MARQNSIDSFSLINEISAKGPFLQEDHLITTNAKIIEEIEDSYHPCKCRDSLTTKKDNESFEETESDLSMNESSDERLVDEFNDTNHFDEVLSEIIEQQVALTAKPGKRSAKSCTGYFCWVKELLNKNLGLSLKIDNNPDKATKKAIEDFQLKYGLKVSGEVNPPTERALLETDTIRRYKGTGYEASTTTLLATAKISIEDWTDRAKNTKPRFILNENRDLRKIYAFVLHQFSYSRKDPKTGKPIFAKQYLETGAHFLILFSGRIIQLHACSRMIWHGECLSRQSVSVEFEGNLPDIEGKWYHDSKGGSPEDKPTEEQFTAGRFLLTYLKFVLGIERVYAHRQSSNKRINDPGPDIWFNVGQWGIENFKLSDTEYPGYKCGTGSYIEPAWRTWKSKLPGPPVNPEYNESIKETLEAYNEYKILETEDDSEMQFDEVEKTGDDSETLIYEMSDFTSDWTNAIRQNKYYSGTLGWNNFYEQINDLLIPFSGQQGMSLGEEAFAQAVAAWQQQQGFSAKDSDGIIGPNTWRRMQPLLRTTRVTSQPPAPATNTGPSPQNIFEFNKWHAQRILDKMNTGIFGSNFNSRSQLEKIVRGEQVLRIDPNQAVIKVLPIIDHIGEEAASENYDKIIIGSFIRDAVNGKCTGHCAGRCIDINYKDGNFNTNGSVEMVIKILGYLLSLPAQFKRLLGFGMPLQGNFFGNQSITKFKSVSSSLLLNAELRQLLPQLGIVFPDNDNHLHIQVNWELQGISSNPTSTTTTTTNTGAAPSNAQAEWSANPGIKARYPNWQMYDAKRNDVLGWGISNPAPYIENAIQEWNANPGIHRHFGNNFDGDPHNSYLNLKRLYQAKGITNPASYFATNIVSTSFFNRSTPAHINLKQALTNAQSALMSRGLNFNFTSAWSFVPRTFNTNINNLSNHALGRAIDIDPSVNPHIISNEEILVINAVCRSVLPAGLLAESNPDILRQASDHFRNTFNTSWINQQTQTTLISAIQKKRSTLDKYARNGFLNLSPVLIRALQSAGLGWGGAWRNSKDFMHFELP